METDAFRQMRVVEDHHWWYRSLRDLVERHSRGKRVVLDVGCGTGGMLSRWRGTATRAFGLDVSPLALSLCRERGLTGLVRGSAQALPFSDESFGAILYLDVLYHRQVEDDALAIREGARVLGPGD
jgi:ubiquinone/menaquinone biosynthesis C-methylase UbiE